ncbi:uncharacterized protein ARMOST_02479 [Armillaria ostoyae]|uniref:Oxidoreductase, short chain dehydrogenase/reductase family n=1 Tax=Armillaria ostoyae TaxID=47428 RepID=A0A284QRT3_ARMOS|nr:uncharacterized protein ARMOST_02479 [Armillaria ostoyae]
MPDVPNRQNAAAKQTTVPIFLQPVKRTSTDPGLLLLALAGTPTPGLFQCLGCGTGTRATAACLFTKEGYVITLIARGTDSLKALSDGITAKPFLDVTFNDIQAVMQTNIEEALTFSKNVFLAFQISGLDKTGKRGALIFTGATPSIRGSATTSAFSAGKHALGSLSQSLVKEFGKQNIHVSHAIIDGGILVTLIRKNLRDPEWENSEYTRLSPEVLPTPRRTAPLDVAMASVRAMRMNYGVESSPSSYFGLSTNNA